MGEVRGTMIMSNDGDLVIVSSDKQFEHPSLEDSGEHSNAPC